MSLTIIQFKPFNIQRVYKMLKCQFNVSIEEVQKLCDPYELECQAYSRIGENHNIAVQCYGRVTFPTRHKVASRFIRTLPIRGLVKELIPGDVPPFTLEQVGKMETDFKTLMQMGIIMLDIKPENYGEGRARDFSRSWTAPNWIPKILRKDFRVAVAQFNHMIEEGIGTSTVSACKTAS
jgi:hypothetical protein